MPESWFNIVLNKTMSDAAEVTIYDQIGERMDRGSGEKVGISAKKFTEDFAAIKAKKINLRINSVGGEVFEGFAIANAIKDHSAEVHVKIDSLAASISAVIAMSGDTVCIAKNGYLMIHDPLCAVFGNSEDLRDEAKRLDQLANTIAQTFADKSGKSIEDVRAKMRDETWFDSASAKEFGLVDVIDGEDDDSDGGAMDKKTLAVAVARFKKAPEKLRRFAASLSVPAPKPPVEKNTMPEKIIARDGKLFVSIGGVEHEIETPVAAAPAPVAQVVDVDAARKEASSATISAEREYRKTFNAVVALAGFSTDQAKEFEAKFYAYGEDRLPEKQLKFLAENAIGDRAKPAGEGSGNPEPKAEKTEAEAAEADTKAYCTKRFANDASMRRRFRVNTTNAADAGYIAGLERFIAVENKCRADEARPRTAKGREIEAENDGDDVITKLHKNKSVWAPVGA